MKYTSIIVLIFVFGVALFATSNFMANSASASQSNDPLGINLTFGGFARSNSITINTVCGGVSCPMPNTIDLAN